MIDADTGSIVDFSTLGHDVKELLKASVRARDRSYSPYSKFSVGAALQCDDGTVYTGCNVENAAYGSSICAEKTAIVKAVSDGNTKYTAIAISAGLVNGSFTSPCGSCRQVISEFYDGKDIIIYLVNPEMKKVLVTSIRELLPLGFKF